MIQADYTLILWYLGITCCLLSSYMKVIYLMWFLIRLLIVKVLDSGRMRCCNKASIETQRLSQLDGKSLYYNNYVIYQGIDYLWLLCLPITSTNPHIFNLTLRSSTYTRVSILISLVITTSTIFVHTVYNLKLYLGCTTDA